MDSNRTVRVSQTAAMLANGQQLDRNSSIAFGNINGSANNNNGGLPLPQDLRFSDDTLVSVIAYSCLFVVAAGGNLTVFITLLRTKGFKSRVDVFIMHLSMADLIVAFVFMPLETIWHVTVSWEAGDLACRICMFFRAFGFYLSSFLLVTISLDRYISIVHPLARYSTRRRTKWMLGAAWGLSFLCSLPQSIIFHVEHHPAYPWFTQCVTYNFFPTKDHEMAYNIFNFIMVYMLPLIVIVITYILILTNISRNARNVTNTAPMVKIEHDVASSSIRFSGDQVVRCSTARRMGKAKMRTLKMTLVIVSVFIMCWTPYFFVLSLHWFHKAWAVNMDRKIQRALLIFAVSNSCIDPAVYGMFTSTFRKEAKKWKACIIKRFQKVT